MHHDDPISPAPRRRLPGGEAPLPSLADRPPHGAAGDGAHVGAAAGRLVDVRTRELPNDGSASAFFDDGGVRPFSVPDGSCLVVTDLVVRPDPTRPDAGARVLAHVHLASDAARAFSAMVLGSETQHCAFAAGLVVPAGLAPAVANDPGSSVGCEVQLLGYLVETPAS